MKIARNLALSGRLDEWYSPFPAPSLRELSSECETEGVYPDERKRSKITEPVGLSGKLWAWSNHRTTLPQSALRAASSLREGAGKGFHHSTGYSLKSGVTGDFHRPYEIAFYCAVRRADRAQMWAAVSLGMCWRWDWRIWASWAGLSSRDRAFSSSPRRRTAGTAMEVST